MKILVICQYYTPEPFRHPDFCEELVKRGHEVTVVTGLPNYPMGEICEGYRHGEGRDETVNGVKVHRCFTIGRKTGIVRRFLNYYSYAISSSLFVRTLKEKFDVVFVNQLSPVMMANAGIVYKKKCNIKLVLYCLDLWPESLVAGGIKRDSVIYKFFHKISERIYKRVDTALLTSQSFAEYFEKEFNITNTGYLPQYAETIFNPEKCKKQQNDFIDLMFAGNLGTVQSVHTIIEAARLTSEEKHIRWHIVGDGSEYLHLKEIAKDLSNVFFYGRKTLEEMPAYYSMADAMLVTSNNDTVANMTLPGKVQSYMAAGKPIIGAVGGETKKIIDEARCGFTCKIGEAEELASIAQHLSVVEFAELGMNAYNYYCEHFRKEVFIQKLEKWLEE